MPKKNMREKIHICTFSATFKVANYATGYYNEKDNLSKKELRAFKEFSKILLNLLPESIRVAIENGDFIEVKS